MKETLLKKVKPETLEKLLSAFGDVLDGFCSLPFKVWHIVPLPIA